MTQRAYVLDRLRQAGKHGVHTFELRAEFIGNPSERVRELTAEGYSIRCVRERPAPKRAMGVRYFLMGEPELSGVARGSGLGPGRSPAVSQSPLFDLPVRGDYRDVEAA